MDYNERNDILETVVTNGRWENTSDVNELVAECEFEASERGLDWTSEDTEWVEERY